MESFFSPALGVSKHFLIYLPPSYGTDRSRRYPVAYYLHGYSGNESDWVALAELDRVEDSLIATGLPPLIVVMPDGDNGWYTDWAREHTFAECMADTALSGRGTTFCTARQRYATYVARDLVAHIDSTYRTRADRRHRGIAGLSMGGYGAITLALAHPDVFGAAASHSGVLSPLYAGPTPFAPPPRYYTSMDSVAAHWEGFWPGIGPAFGSDTGGWYARDPARLARRLVASRRPVPALSIDVGTEDGLVSENRAFHAELTALGIVHRYAESPGAHEWRYWRNHVTESLAWLAEEIGK
ncbi:MAG TPA: alpha/beta hydrolase family protein [Gemmatimonadales bacterium]|nr:alpha/beta hydrolase family protein [Gemmatimonadales bacterium]